MNEGYPLWLIIMLALLAAIGTFWSQIKSSYELIVGGKHSLEALKLKNEAEEIGKLKARLTLIEDRNIKLIKSNTALSTAIIFMIDEYQKSNPENKTVIESVKQLIKENLINGS